MEPVVRKLILKRFRSIKETEIDLANPTFLVGKNGSGKSNFADVFAFLSEIMSSPLQAVFDSRGGISAVRYRSSSHSGPPNLGLAVEFGAFNEMMNSGRYAFEITALPNYGFAVIQEEGRVTDAQGRQYWFKRKGTDLETSVEGLKPSLEPNLLVLPLIAGDARFAPLLKVLSSMRKYQIEPHRLREMQDPDGGTVLRSDGGNAASVLREIEKDEEELRRLEEILASIVPNTHQVRQKKYGNKLVLRFTQRWGEEGKERSLNFDGYAMSDGTLRILGILLAVFQRPRPSLIVLEEPERTIHPGALGAVLDLIRHASRFMQVLVTTHSPEVLDAEWITDEHLRIAVWQNGATYIRPLANDSREALKKHLMSPGELLRANALHPEALFEKDLGVGKLFEEWA